jgi:hypothetical protein
MKKVLLMTLAMLMVCSSIALADHIGVYEDQLGTDCVKTSFAAFPNPNSMYIVHKFNPGSTASQFKVNDTTGFIASSQTTPYLSIGTWNVDLSLAYGGCVVGDHVLMTLNFFVIAPPASCSAQLAIVPAPGSPIPGSVALVDCAVPSGNLKPASAGSMYFLDNCIDPSACNPTATSSKTWGGVKALYR